MPKRSRRDEHVRGAGDKEQRQFEHIMQSAEKAGRFGDRAEDVAARTVLKRHKDEHHKVGE